MNSLADEIQRISDDADKCINYPIGSKLADFFRQQDEQNSPNFVLSGVLIYAAAKIFGRKVDCLEQEILGVAKNFEKVDAENGKEKDQKEEGKKTRTKKYTIRDGVNIDKILFDEKEILLAVKEDINKNLAVPSKISRLQKMQDFFARNKEKSGKIAIPKSMLLTNELAVTNFGSTQIHDYDDYKDIVGSRRDFTSFSFFINSCTGELQNDLNFSKQQSKLNDYVLIDHQLPKSENITADKTASDSLVTEHVKTDLTVDTTESTLNLSEEFMNIDHHHIEDFTPPLTPCSPTLLSGKVSPMNLNLDEGIEMDIDQSNLLMPIQPILKVTDFLRQSPSLFPCPVNVNDYVVMNFSRSVVSVIDEIKNRSTDFSLPENLKSEVRDNKMKNIFMVPLKKLKHKCLFDLPDSEFKELKRRKLDQHKSTVVEQPNRQSRIFKFLDMLKTCNMSALNSSINLSEIEDEDTPFLGFSKDEQKESHLPMPYNSKETKTNTTKPTIDSHQTTIDDNSIQTENIQSSLRKASNDSGYTSEFINSSNEIDSTKNEESSCRLDSIYEESESTTQKNISGTDSCYQSLLSGQSGIDESSTINQPSFIDEFNVRNSTENELDISNDKAEQQASLESEERIQLMKQSAINIAKWKDFLKPILAQSEKRSKIDMHEYGLKVINKIGNVNESKTLNEIAERDQMPAYFFTMLQLTNNRNIDITYTNKSIHEPTALSNIKLTLKSKNVHKEKFDEMGQQFEEAETLKKVGKRKGHNLNIQTSTPAKRSFIPNESLSFNTPNSSQSIIDNTNNSMQILSQASSGYFSQNSTYSDF